METLIKAKENSNFNLKFYGKGATYFGIVALNVLLTVVTLGIYYPWARVAYRKYIWNESEMKGSRFVFHGTGKEMLKGWLIVYGIFVGFYACLALIGQYTWASFLLFGIYILFFLLAPFAVYGAWRYRMTRTSWRGIFFQFDGNFKVFMKMFYKELFFTLITFGIYGFWMRVNVMKYLFSHTKIGNIRMGFKGDGGELLGITFVGGLLSAITLYLYIPVYIKNLFNFTIDNTTLSDGEKEKRLKSTLTGGKAWTTLMGNFLLLMITAGLAFPWTFVRTMRMYFDHVQIPEDFDWDNLEQTTDEQYKNATGDQLADAFDFDFDFGF